MLFKNVTLGIDASNIRGGGGLTHLIAFLKHLDIEPSAIDRLIIWGATSVLDQLPTSPFLVKVHHSFLNRGLFFRLLWQFFIFKKQARSTCDLLLYPGGNAFYKKIPYVIMNRNLLPFMYSELSRYRFSFVTLRLILLRYSQLYSYKKSIGVVFLSEYAKQKVLKLTRVHHATIIPHGRSTFSLPVSTPVSSVRKGFKLLYVSIIDVYKHHLEVLSAVSMLRERGVLIELELIGPAYKPALRRLQKAIQFYDPGKSYITYTPFLPHDLILKRYYESDAFIFASSCETFGQILLEAMAAKLPIVCANRTAMPEILGDAGLYFDPENPGDIAEKIQMLYHDPSLRQQLAEKAYQRSLQYDWGKCAKETLDYITSSYERYRLTHPKYFVPIAKMNEAVFP